jgi:tRNA(fMet)-specific endonuclease VapC
MTAFDTDVLSELLQGDPSYLAKLAAVDPADRFVPVVAVAEVFRGWLNAVRQAEAGKGRISLELAYREFAKTVAGAADYAVLPYTAGADALFRQWRASGIRIGTQDLRIAAICFAHGAKLVTRNAQDYAQVPGLNLEVWN